MDATLALARGTETVLVVDDEAPIRKVVRYMLASAGYGAREATSGRKAIALLSDVKAASEVSLVLLDVSMPGLSGRELIRQIRKLAPHARIVLFTGYPLGADARDGIEHGADALLQKPATAEGLLATLRQVLDRRG